MRHQTSRTVESKWYSHFTRLFLRVCEQSLGTRLMYRWRNISPWYSVATTQHSYLLWTDKTPLGQLNISWLKESSSFEEWFCALLYIHVAVTNLCTTLIKGGCPHFSLLSIEREATLKTKTIHMYTFLWVAPKTAFHHVSMLSCRRWSLYLLQVLFLLCVWHCRDMCPHTIPCLYCLTTIFPEPHTLHHTISWFLLQEICNMVFGETPVQEGYVGVQWSLSENPWLLGDTRKCIGSIQVCERTH